MKYAVDRIEENIVILEDMASGEIIEKKISDIDCNVKEKDILILKNGIFINSEYEKINREELMKQKLERLKNL